MLNFTPHVSILESVISNFLHFGIIFNVSVRLSNSLRIHSFYELPL